MKMRTDTQTPKAKPAKLRPEVCAVPCFKEAVVKEVKAALPGDPAVRTAAAFFGALADPSRLKIILALAHEELCVCDVSHVVGLSMSATSHQLRLLRNMGFVHYRNDGKMAYYSLAETSAVLPLIKAALER